MNGDQNLLLGVMALQMDFLSRDALIDGLHDWVRDKGKQLGELLCARGWLSAAQLQVLNLLVEQHVLAHQGDARRSLAAVPVSAGNTFALRLLRDLRDPALQSALNSLGTARSNADPEATAAQPEQAPRSRVRYQILRPHAKGGLGEVFVALDEELNREVALKEMQPHHAVVAPSRARFVLEAEITGGLEHPGIVPVYGLGTYPDGRPYYAMRFIRGDNLKEAVARFHCSSPSPLAGAGRGVGNRQAAGRPPTPALPREGGGGRADFDSLAFRDLLRRFLDVCNAIAYAHSRGVLHRDLKPGNVMLGNFGETLVVDWGLAKVVNSPARSASEGFSDENMLRPSSASGSTPTEMGSALGTPAYMSPEQAAGRLDQIGPATDIYSLGATLFSILTNCPPLEGKDIGEILRRVQAGDVGFNSNADSADSRRGSSLRLSAESAFPVPPPLRAICQKAMSLDPADRYPTVLDLARDVENWLADEPVGAYGEPWPVRARRWARKHRTLVSTAAGIVLVALLALTAGLIIVSSYNGQLETANGRLEVANGQLETANQQMERANVELKERKQIAEETCTEALDAVKSQVFDINKELRNRAGTRDLREKLQRNAIERLEMLVERTTQRAAADHTAFWAHTNLGDVYRNVDLKPSLARVEYEKGHAIAATLAAADPRDARAQRDLSVSLGRLGDVSLQTGDTAAAVRFYTENLDINRKLAAADPRDARAQRDLSISFENLGDVSHRTGDTAAAVKFYTARHDICKRLAADKPRDAQAQRDLSTSFERMGDISRQAGDASAAVKHFSDGLDIRKKLAADKPRDAQAQRDLAISLDRLGDVSRQAGDAAAAVKYYTDGLDPRKKLAAADPRDAGVQRELAASFDKLGIVSLMAGDTAAALRYHTDAFDIHKKLAAADARDARAQRDLSISLERLGDVSHRTGDTAVAVKFYTDSLDIHKRLAAADPRDTRAQRDLSISLEKLGDVSHKAGDTATAVKFYTDSLDISKKFAAANPRDAQAQGDLLIGHIKLGTAEQQGLRFAAAAACFEKALALLGQLKERGMIKNDRELIGTMSYAKWLSGCEEDLQACRRWAKLQPALSDDPAWPLLWGWPRF